MSDTLILKEPNSAWRLIYQDFSVYETGFYWVNAGDPQSRIPTAITPNMTKDFLSDATLIQEANSPYFINKIWRKPDGSQWHESQSRLESHYGGYNLSPIKKTHPYPEYLGESEIP